MRCAYVVLQTGPKNDQNDPDRQSAYRPWALMKSDAESTVLLRMDSPAVFVGRPNAKGTGLAPDPFHLK
jgi:hypothetical protein